LFPQAGFGVQPISDTIIILEVRINATLSIDILGRKKKRFIFDKINIMNVLTKNSKLAIPKNTKIYQMALKLLMQKLKPESSLNYTNSFKSIS